MEGIYGKSDRAKRVERAINAFKGLSASETKRRILEGDEGEEAPSKSGGNTGLPFGLCKKHGISLPPNATPRDAWEALKNKTGLSPQDFYDRLKEGRDRNGREQGETDGANGGQIEQEFATKSDRIETCTTHAELGEYFHKTYGVTVDASVHSLDFPSVHSAASGMDIVLREFPQAKGVLRSVSTSSSGLMCARPNGEICFNPSFFKNGEATIQQRMEQSSRSGYHPKNSGARECGAHEMGHMLELALIQRRYPNGGGTLAWNKCIMAKEIVSEACKNIKRQTRQSFDVIRSEVSTYANENFSECLAECVSDYIANRTNAAALSKYVWQRLKEELQ